MPANVVNRFLNGATLNLDALAPMINDSDFLPEGTTFEGLSTAAMMNLSQMPAGALGWDGDGNPLADSAALLD